MGFALHNPWFFVQCWKDHYLSFFIFHLAIVLSVPSSVNLIGGVMVSVLASSVVDRGFEPRSGQTRDYKIGICCFSTKYVVLMRKSKDWLARNQNNMSEMRDMSTHGVLFRWASTIKIQLSVLVQSNTELDIISLTIKLFSP